MGAYRSAEAEATIGMQAAAAITQLLNLAACGDQAARESLWNAVYSELRNLAQMQLAAGDGRGRLQPTLLVHEVYLRLLGDGNSSWENRRHFFAAAADSMHRIRVDDARNRRRLKRGGGRQTVPLTDEPMAEEHDPLEILAINETLDRLKAADPIKYEIVSLRYFVGLTVEETAAAVGVSPRTVESEWRFAKVWLFRELKKGDTANT